MGMQEHVILVVNILDGRTLCDPVKYRQSGLIQAVTTVEVQTEDLLQFLLVCRGTYQIIKNWILYKINFDAWFLQVQQILSNTQK